ncbi:MAG TPA: hypothetical protein VE035_03125 [Puia sp.]|nr:hypothetical protein [Puia sp.]
MKKIDLVHTTILIIALLAGYSALEQLLALLSLLSYSTDLYYMRGGASQGAFYTVINMILYAACCVILIRNGRRYAALILKDEPEGSWEDAAQLQLDRQNLIFVLLVGMGLYTLLQSIPYLFRDLFDLFREKIGADPFKATKPSSRPLIFELLRVTLATMLIYAAAPITNFINQHIASRLKGDS